MYQVTHSPFEPDDLDWFVRNDDEVVAKFKSQTEADRFCEWMNRPRVPPNEIPPPTQGRRMRF